MTSFAVRGSRLIGIAVAAALCVANAWDRSPGASVHKLSLLNRVGFGLSYYRNKAVSALETNDTDSAIAAARHVVNRDPTVSRSLSVLGGAELAAGNATAANQAFRIAGSQGWRDPITQSYWMREGFGLGDYPVAAERTDALARTGLWDSESELEFQLLEGSAAGRRALASRLTNATPWIEAYIEGLAALDANDAINRISVLARARQDGLTIDDDMLASATSRTLQQSPKIALQLWSVFKGSGDLANKGLWDADFKMQGKGASGSPFEWQMKNLAAASAGIGQAPEPLGTRALHVTSTSTHSEQVAYQIMALLPGTYTAAWSAIDTGDKAMPALRTDVYCLNQKLIGRPSIDHDGIRQSRSFTVPPANCAAQRLVVVIYPSSAGSSSGWLGNVAISAAQPMSSP